MFCFEVIVRRYEHAPSILTRDKGVEEWGEIFGDEVMTAAPIERLLHHCHIVNICGNIYCLLEDT